MQEITFDQQTGCTVGALHTGSGLLIFKNRDLPPEFHLNEQTSFRSSSDMYSLEGANLNTCESAGVSIGVNNFKICVASTHIETTSDMSYDLLCETILNLARFKSDVPKVVAEFMRQNSLQGGRILVSSLNWIYLVEVYKKEFYLQEIDQNKVITNSFEYLSSKVRRSEDFEFSSKNRLRAAKQLISVSPTVEKIKNLLRSHIPEKGALSICNHRPDGGGTESSHIIRINENNISWSFLIGFPCENDYATIQLFQQ